MHSRKSTFLFEQSLTESHGGHSVYSWNLSSVPSTSTLGVLGMSAPYQCMHHMQSSALQLEPPSTARFCERREVIQAPVERIASTSTELIFGERIATATGAATFIPTGSHKVSCQGGSWHRCPTGRCSPNPYGTTPYPQLSPQWRQGTGSQGARYFFIAWNGCCHLAEALVHQVAPGRSARWLRHAMHVTVAGGYVRHTCDTFTTSSGK